MKFKKSLLNNIFLRRVLSFFINLYLRFVYVTSNWQIVTPQGYNIQLPKFTKTIIVAWHNRVGIMPHILRRIKNFYALASSHPDGMIIAWILRFFGNNLILGSTNRNAFSALKEVIKVLKQGGSVGITPDGPRGPIYKINSNMASAAILSDAEIIVVGCYISRYKLLKTWDRFIFPLPFSKGTFVIDNAIKISKDSNIEEINVFLEKRMNELNDIAEKLTKSK